MERLLYKYRPWNDRTKDILTSHRLYIPTPAEFNDPFDCRPAFLFSASKNQKKAKLREVQRERRFEYIVRASPGEINMLARSPEFSESLTKSASTHWKASMSRIGVLCLTAIPDSILMWSHYSDSHNGVCFGFDASPNTLFGQAKEVLYSKHYPSFNYITQKLHEVADIGLRKAQDWSYEQEFRLIGKRDVQFMQFPPTLLRSVIVGCAMPPSHKAELRSLLRTRAVPVTIFEARKAENEFRLDLIETEKINE